jgi:AcrR family transcriptional regulator
MEAKMSPRPDVSEARKNQILDAASTVFARLGFHEARMDDIVAEAKLSKGALYWYFKSKDAIISGLLDRLFNHELAGLRALETADGAVSARLRTYTRQMAATIEQMQFLSAIAFEFYAIAGRHASVRRALKHYFQTYEEVLVRLFRQGITRGEFRALDPEVPARTLLALYEGTALLWFIDPQRVRWTEQTIQAVDLLLAGLQPTDPPTLRPIQNQEVPP